MRNGNLGVTVDKLISLVKRHSNAPSSQAVDQRAQTKRSRFAILLNVRDQKIAVLPWPLSCKTLALMLSKMAVAIPVLLRKQKI